MLKVDFCTFPDALAREKAATADLPWDSFHKQFFPNDLRHSSKRYLHLVRDPGGGGTGGFSR